MVQPLPTHSISFSLRIPQRFSFFPYKSSLLAHSVTLGLQARTPAAWTATMAPVLVTSKRAWKYLFPLSACLALILVLKVLIYQERHSSGSGLPSAIITHICISPKPSYGVTGYIPPLITCYRNSLRVVSPPCTHGEVRG